MPERSDSVDSFDDFFGSSKTDNDRKKSPIRRKESEPTVAAIAKNIPTVKRPQTPSTPEERSISSPEPKPKVNNAKPNGHIRNKSPVVSDRTESVQQKDYDSDFDDDNGFDDDQSTVISVDQKKKHGSLPPPKQRQQPPAVPTPPAKITRRGSDSELKKSYTVTPPSKTNNATGKRRQKNILPYIRPQQTRPAAYPIRRHREILSNSAKNEREEREASAKTNELNRLEARITELRQQLAEQRMENSTLRTIQRREEKAIKKYEEKEYDIHRIVRDYTHEIDHIKHVLDKEREMKMRMEKQIETRDEKLHDQTQLLKKYEKIVKEKSLDERYELKEKLVETDKKLQTFQEKVTNQERYIENLEKNHRHEIKQELTKQRALKRQLEERSDKYNELLQKFEDKTRQIESMHIYAQRTQNLTKSRSLQSLNESTPRKRQEKIPRESEKKTRTRPAPSTNDVPAKKTVPKSDSTEHKPSTTQNGHAPAKGKAPVRRLSTPKSIEEEESKIDDVDDFFDSSSKKKPPPPPPTTIQRSEQHITQAQIHKRPTASISSRSESKNNASGADHSSTAPSSIFKLTEPPPLPKSKARPTRDIDEKWSDLFGSNKQEDSAKEDLLAKLVADEQQERRAAAATQPPPAHRPTMTTFESSTRSTTQPTRPAPAADPFESLFTNDSKKPPASREKNLDDIFSTKPSNSMTTTAPTRNDPFESLFGPASTSTNHNHSHPSSSSNDRLSRPKVVQNPTKSIPNRVVIDEVEDFLL